MKKLILPLLIICIFNITALAVEINPAQTEDPKKAEERLVTKDQAKKIALDEKKKDLKAKHAAKKAAAVAAKTAAAKVVSGDETPAKSAAVDPLKDVKREVKMQERKEENAPKK